MPIWGTVLKAFDLCVNSQKVMLEVETQEKSKYNCHPKWHLSPVNIWYIYLYGLSAENKKEYILNVTE